MTSKKEEAGRKREVGVHVAVTRTRSLRKEQKKKNTKATALWTGWGRLPPLRLPLTRLDSTPPNQEKVVKTLVKPHQFVLNLCRSPSLSGLESGTGLHESQWRRPRPRRSAVEPVPKHPSQPPFTGFCSACLLERLSTARFPSPSPIAAAAEISTEIPQPRVRTTLLCLFQLDDDDDMAPPTVGEQGQGVSDQVQQVRGDQDDEQGQGRQLQRKRSLRQSCEWIVCCDTTADSRQSWDGSASASASAGAPNALLSNPIIRGFVTRPAQMLRRSLSESWRHARGDAAPAAIPINGGGSRSVSSAGMDSEISLGDSIHADTHNAAPRQSSLLKRLYRLGRSRSVHCSSPQIRSIDTGTLRFHLTPLRSSSRRSIANKIQGRRLNLFAHGNFFANQRQQL